MSAAPSPVRSLVLVSDLDALVREAESPSWKARLRKLGLEMEGAPRLGTLRARALEGIEARWRNAYERARQRYGRGVAAVRERVCAGCYVTLPSIARPRSGEPAPLVMCESCGRLLYWS